MMSKFSKNELLTSALRALVSMTHLFYLRLA